MICGDELRKMCGMILVLRAQPWLLGVAELVTDIQGSHIYRVGPVLRSTGLLIDYLSAGGDRESLGL